MVLNPSFVPVATPPNVALQPQLKTVPQQSTPTAPPPAHLPKYHHKFETAELLPWATLLGLAAYGYALPAAVIVLTQAIATNFFFSFNGQDLVGMGVPRVSKSLSRGATPYNPATDPVAQQKHGLSRTLYIKRQELNHANWSNLKEEMSREVEAAPGMLVISLTGFALLRPLMRLTHWPMGRRTVELPHADVKALGNAFTQFYQQNEASLQHQPFKTTVAQFYKQLFADEKHPLTGDSLLDTPVHLDTTFGHRAAEPDYTLSPKHLKLLADNNVDGTQTELANLPKRQGLWPFDRYPQGQEPRVQRPTTLRHLIDQYADTMAEHVGYELDGTKAAVLWSQQAREKNDLAHAKLSYYTQLLGDAVQEVNADRLPTHQQHLDGWAVHWGGDSPTTKGLVGKEGVLRYADKFRDALGDVGRLVADARKAHPQGALTAETVGKAMTGVTQHVGGLKVVATAFFTVATSYYMWWLSHAIQKGREYPANTLVSESIHAVNHVSTATPSSTVLQSATLGQTPSQPLATNPFTLRETSQTMPPQFTTTPPLAGGHTA